jgi:hypothetical protein
LNPSWARAATTAAPATLPMPTAVDTSVLVLSGSRPIEASWLRHVAVYFGHAISSTWSDAYAMAMLRFVFVASLPGRRGMFEETPTAVGLYGAMASNHDCVDSVVV